MQNDWRTAVTFSNNLHGRTTVIFSKNIRTNYILPNIIITIKPPTNEPGCRSGNTLCSNSMSELPNARSKSSSNFSAQKLRGARTAGTFQYRRSFSNNLRRAQDLHTHPCSFQYRHVGWDKIFIQLLRKDNTALIQAVYNELIIAMRQLV